MDFLHDGISVALYAVVALCGTTLLALWANAKRDRRNAGFASRAHLKKQMSAKAVLRASEIRPSLSDGSAPPRTSTTSRATRPKHLPF